MSTRSDQQKSDSVHCTTAGSPHAAFRLIVPVLNVLLRSLGESSSIYTRVEYVLRYSLAGIHDFRPSHGPDEATTALRSASARFEAVHP